VFGWCQFWAENVKIWWRKNSSELFKRRIETIKTYNNSKLNYQKALKWKKDDQLKFLPLLRGRRLLGGVGLFYPLRIVTRDCWNGAISIETFIATENSCCAPRFPLTGCQVTLCSGVENFGNVRVGHFPSDSATLICTRTINHPNNCVVDESGLSCMRSVVSVSMKNCFQQVFSVLWYVLLRRTGCFTVVRAWDCWPASKQEESKARVFFVALGQNEEASFAIGFD